MGDQATRTRTTRSPQRGRIPGRVAAQRVQEAERLVVDLPFVGSVRLPRPEQLAYFGAVGVLVALEIVEWPIALVLATGHVLAQQQHSRAFQQLGEGLEDA